MNVNSIIFAIFALFFSVIFLTYRKKKKKKNRNLPPSPPSLPFLGHLHHLWKPLHQSLALLSARHGPLLFLRFGLRPAIAVSSLSLAEECFTTNDRAFANRIKLLSHSAVTYDYTIIGSAPYGPGWRDMRRLANIEVLSGHRLAFFSETRVDEARRLARQLFHDSAVQDFTTVELRPRLFGFAMNVMMRTMAGKRYYGESSTDEGARRFQEMVEKTFSLSGASSIAENFPSALGWFARRRAKSKLDRAHRFADEFMQALVEERRKKKGEAENEGGELADQGRDNETLLDALLSLQKAQPEQYDDKFIKSLFAVII